MNEFTNYPSHEKMLYIFGNARGVRCFSKKQEFCENIYRMNVGVCDEKTMKGIVDFIKKKRPYAIHASASNFVPLIDYMRKHKIKNKTSIRSVITGGEMVPASLRKSIIEVFGKNTKVYVKYSNEEMGILGVDSGIETPYHLNWADYYFEILKMDSDEPCKIGEIGRIVITDLFNYALPLIRYDTGDIGSFGEKDGKIVIDHLNGKRRDLIYDIYGNPICGATITNLIKEIKNTKMYQLIQNTENEYTFRVVPFDGITPSNEDLLLKDIQELLGGVNANLTVEYVDDIPETNSQKRRYTVNLYKPQ